MGAQCSKHHGRAGTAVGEFQATAAGTVHYSQPVPTRHRPGPVFRAHGEHIAHGEHQSCCNAPTACSSFQPHSSSQVELLVSSSPDNVSVAAQQHYGVLAEFGGVPSTNISTPMRVAAANPQDACMPLSGVAGGVVAVWALPYWRFCPQTLG